MIKLFLRTLKRLITENNKTIYFNFKYLSFSQALTFPVILSKNVVLHTLNGDIVFECPIYYGIIKIGFGDIGIFDKEKSRTILEINGKMIFKGKAHIGHGSKISVSKNAELIFGPGFTITAESSIIATKKIVFGKSCLLSWDVLIMDTDFHNIKNDLGEIINEPKPIFIGDKVWIGCRSLILKGAIIPSNSILGANSLVNKCLDVSNSIYGGNPVKILKQNISWD